MRSILILLIAFISCDLLSTESFSNQSTAQLIDTSGMQIATRFNCPPNYQRIDNKPQTFAYWLQHQALFPATHMVKLYNGDEKRNQVYEAVLKIDVGKRDLQQCADAVMRLRAEYLFQHHQKNEISFRFLGDGKMHSFKEYAKGDTSYAKFRKYMDYIFSYANTASLIKQLKKVSVQNVQAGDVLIQTGNPYGHAITVMDVCQDSAGNKLVLLAQSYMPAQEIHILKNFNNSNQSPWFNLNTKIIQTPEWTFDSADLHRF